MYELYRPSIEDGTGSTFTAVPGKLGRPRPRQSNRRQSAYLADLDGSGLPDFIGTGHSASDPWAYRLNTGASGGGRFAAGVETTIRGDSLYDQFAMDTNGDGLTELIGFGRTGWDSWGLVPSELQAEWQVRKRSLNLQGGPFTTHFGDVNGDGLVDAVLPHGLAPDGPSGLRVQLNSGNGFGSPLSAQSPAGYNGPPAPTHPRDVGVRIVDFNGDGRDDILMLGEDAVYLWGNKGFTRIELGLDIDYPSAARDSTQVLDLNGDGALDLVSAGGDDLLRVYQRKGGVPDLLIAVGNATFRDRTEISYTTLAKGALMPAATGVSTGLHTPGTCAYPVTCPLSGGSVVASHAVMSESGPDNEVSSDRYWHFYAGARADLHGRGWLGFAEHRVTRDATHATTVTTFNNVSRDPRTKSYPYSHLPRTERYTVADAHGPFGRVYRRSVDRRFVIRRHKGGTYTVEERLSILAEDEKALGATKWDHFASQRQNTDTTTSEIQT